MTRHAVAVALALVILYGMSVPLGNAQQPPRFDATGSLAGTGLWTCWLCDINGVRNIQGGELTGNPKDLNLDLGAGNDRDEGTIVFQYDVGTGRAIFYNGEMAPGGPRGRKLFEIGPRRIVAYVPIVVRVQR